MTATFLPGKAKNGKAIPNAAIARPPSAGPAARPTLKPTPLTAVALSRSCLGTSIGIVAPQAGEVSAPPTPSRNVVASRSEGVESFRETRPAKATDTARIATSTAISRRRESMTSAKAPEGRVNRNNGRLTATCTRDTVIGLASRLVINQPDAVSNIAVPTFETRLAVHITLNARWLNGPHREGAGSVGAATVVRSALKRNSRRGIRAPPEATCQSTAEYLLSYIPRIDDRTSARQQRALQR